MRWRFPDPTGGAHDAPPNPLVGWGWQPLSNPSPLGAFGASILALSALSFGGPQCKILATPLDKSSLVLFINVVLTC